VRLVVISAPQSTITTITNIMSCPRHHVHDLLSSCQPLSDLPAFASVFSWTHCYTFASRIGERFVVLGDDAYCLDANYIWKSSNASKQPSPAKGPTRAVMRIIIVTVDDDDDDEGT
jgi:hypothetical protein